VRDIFPIWYQTPLNPASVIECVIINWLAQELPIPEELAQALLQIKGWRRADVIEFMKDWDWTAGMYEGQPIARYEHEMWTDEYRRKINRR
jgi:hypothetical protein